MPFEDISHPSLTQHALPKRRWIAMVGLTAFHPSHSNAVPKRRREETSPRTYQSHPSLTQHALPKRRWIAIIPTVHLSIHDELEGGDNDCETITKASLKTVCHHPTLPLIYPPGQLRFNDRHKRLPRNSVKKKKVVLYAISTMVGVFCRVQLAIFEPISKNLLPLQGAAGRFGEHGGRRGNKNNRTHGTVLLSTEGSGTRWASKEIPCAVLCFGTQTSWWRQAMRLQKPFLEHWMNIHHSKAYMG